MLESPIFEHRVSTCQPSPSAFLSRHHVRSRACHTRVAIIFCAHARGTEVQPPPFALTCAVRMSSLHHLRSRAWYACVAIIFALMGVARMCSHHIHARSTSTSPSEVWVRPRGQSFKPSPVPLAKITSAFQDQTGSTGRPCFALSPEIACPLHGFTVWDPE